ncbi:MAG: hypothetical protein Kow0042_08510 [Calditrichia bacterium]
MNRRSLLLTIRLNLNFAILLLSFFLFSGSMPALRAEEQVAWTGYTQFRYTTDYREESGFAVRRAKLWIHGPVPIQKNFTFKVQAIFHAKNHGALDLQDVFAEYYFASGALRFGQMVPDFSLQRHQPDFVIPLVERGKIIRNLIPSAETDARDIGLLLMLHSGDKNLNSSFGVFNGNGGNQLKNEDRKFLFTHRTRVKIALAQNIYLTPGFSLAYRKTSGLAFKKITDSSKFFSGRDWRWGAELHLSGRRWEIQSEYLAVNLADDNAEGFYILGDWYFSPENQIVFSAEKYRDLSARTDDSPWYILGLNHYFAGDKAKLMFDSRFQFAETKTNYLTTLQIQLFFN